MWLKSAALAAAAAAGLLCAQAAPAMADEAELQKVYEAAKGEGKLILWAPTDAPSLKRIADKFSEKYPGVAVEHFDIQPGPAVERMIAESRAGSVNVDAFDANLSYFKPLMDRDLLAQVDWTKYGVDGQYILFGGMAVSHYNLELPITVNTSKVNPADIKSWDDLLDPKYSGSIIIEARGGAFAVLSEKWGVEKTTEYLSKLLAQKPIIIKGGTATLEALAGGQAAIAIGPYPTKVDPFKAKGAPVEWLRVGPIPVNTYGVAILKSAPHPNAARLWAAWLLSVEGQQAMYEVHNMGVLKGPVASVRGKEITGAGIEIVFENEDVEAASKALKTFGAQIGALN